MKYAATDDSFLLSNARLFDHPVVYCSSGFTRLTGWSRHDLLRRSSACPMMHGPLTDPDAVARLRHALQSDTAAEPFELVLYTSNGKLYLKLQSRYGQIPLVRPGLRLFGPGRRVPKSHSRRSCSSCCWNQFSMGPKSLRLS